jgi:hypothetical protein
MYPEDYEEVDELEYKYDVYFAKDCKRKYPEDYKMFKAEFNAKKSATPATATAIVVEKSCSHKCCLESTKECCHCEDKRPADAKTIHYGSADLSKSTEESRKFFYCPYCKYCEVEPTEINKIMNLIRPLSSDHKKLLLFKLIDSMNE